MPDPVYTFGVELAVGSLTDLSSLCLRGSFAQSVGDALRPIVPDSGLFELSNEVGSLSPLLNSNLTIGRRVSLSATYSGSSYNLYSGRIKSIATRPVLGERTTVLETLTDVNRLDRALIRTGVLVNRSVNSLFTEIMSRSNVASFSAVATAVKVPFAWYQNTSALAATRDLVGSGMYEFKVDGAGTMVFRERHSSLWYSPTRTPVATIEESFGFDSAISDSVINSVRVFGTPRLQTTAVATLSYLAQPVTIPASSGVGFFINYVDPRNAVTNVPVGSIVTQVASQDYYASANSDGTGANYTSTLSVAMTSFAATAVASIFNGTGNVAYLSRFQVRGYPILEAAPFGVQVDQASSQSAYGIYGREQATMIPNRDYMLGFGTDLVTKAGFPQTTLGLSLVNDFPNVVNIQAGDVISVINSLTGTNSFWVVGQVQHTLDLWQGLRHQAEYGLDLYRETFPRFCESAAFRSQGFGLPEINSGYLLNPSTLTGVQSDGVRGILSVWFYPGLLMAYSASGTAVFEIGSGGETASNRIPLKLTVAVNSNAATGNMYATALLFGARFDNQQVFSAQGSVAISSGGSWTHFGAAWDLEASPPRLSVFLGDNYITPNIFNGSAVNVSAPTIRVGRDYIPNTISPHTNFTGRIAEVYLNTKEFLDLNIVSNRRKFISPTGKAVDLGPDGSYPTGNPPTIYLKLDAGVTDASSFGYNYGTGGNFTLVNSLDLGTTSPSD